MIKKKRKRIMVDMDEVICGSSFIGVINEFLGTNYKPVDFKSYYIQEMLPDKEAFFKYFLTKNMYDYAVLEPNVVEVLELLNEKYDLYIGTSYIVQGMVSDSGILLLHKYEYLQRILPFINPRQYVFLSNKSVLNCQIKIDDRIDNLEGAKIKLLYSSYHNMDLTDEYLKERGVKRVNNWLDIKKELLDDK